MQSFMQTNIVTAHTGLTTRSVTEKNLRQIIRLVSGRLENKQKNLCYIHCFAHWTKSQHLKPSLL